MISREYRKFSKGLMPLLTAIDNYWLNVFDLPILNQQKKIIENILAHSKQYPEWVFSFRFNPFFRESYQFFLLKLELLAELTLASHYLFEKLFFSLQLKSLYCFIIAAIRDNKELFNYLTYFFMHEKIPENHIDINEDNWKILEEKLYQELPSQLMIPSLLPEESYLINYCQGLKDCRKILLELIAALPK